jgi:hypothetical protein
MKPSDFDQFTAMLGDVFGLKSQALSAGQMAMFFRALADYPLAEVRHGLDAHVKHPERGRFMPMPADVIAAIKGAVADDGRPGAEEAWAMSVRATDEAATVVWTAEMCEAFGVCRPLLDIGDEVGARMAFKESYTRLIQDARARRVEPAWTASLGFDAAARDAVLLPHVEAGRLAPPVIASSALVTMSASPENSAAREKAMQRLRELRDEFANRRARTSGAAA